MVALLVMFTILAFLTVDYFVQRAEVRRTAPLPVIAAATAEVPVDVLLDRRHVWVKPEPGGVLQVGADGLAAALLGPGAGLTCAPVGAVLRRGEPAVSLDDGRRHLTLAAPADGVVVAVNHAADGRAEPAIRDPFGAGWLYRLQPEPGGQREGFLSGSRATAWLREERNRLRDFLLTAAGLEPALGATLPDGGTPLEGSASRLPPEVWEQITAAMFGASADRTHRGMNDLDPSQLPGNRG